MNDPELLEELEKLRWELEQTENLDDEARQRLLRIIADIQALREREEPLLTEHVQSFGDQLTDSIQRYEVSHPALTAVMQRLLEILSRAGI